MAKVLSIRHYFIFFFVLKQVTAWLIVPYIEHVFLHTILYNCTTYAQILGVGYNQVVHRPDLSVLKLYMYNSSGRYPYDLRDINSILSASSFRWDQEVAIVIHGFSNGINDFTVKTLTASLVRRGGVNVFALDTASLTDILYLTAITNSRFIGEALGYGLVEMKRAGVNRIHLIGHSLGAHLAAFAGKMYYRILGLKLYRITALAISGPCYYGPDESMKLSINDAEFVDAIYTDKGLMGTSEIIGHVNFFPNNGELQPGCSISSFCSHIRSYQFFSESAFTPTSFPAVQCRDWNAFKSGRCSGNPIVYMGYDVPRTARGTFFLKTNKASPYGKGLEGLRPEFFSLQIFFNLFSLPMLNLGQPAFLFDTFR